MRKNLMLLIAPSLVFTPTAFGAAQKKSTASRKARQLARADFDHALAQSHEPKPLQFTTLVTIAASVFDQKQMAQKQ